MRTIEVHRALGPAYLEAIYEEAMAIELRAVGVPFERQKPIAVYYRGERVGEGRIDLVVAGILVVELKAVERLAPIHRAQMLSYLKATGCHLGLVINFNEKLVSDGVWRVILS